MRTGTPATASDAQVPAPGSAARRPMARASRVTLFEREIRERLSQPAIELLLRHASVLSEGECTDVPRDAAAPGPGPFFGSTMLTIDLDAIQDAVREPCDASSARRVALLVCGDERFERRMRAIAEREASRLAGRPIASAAAEVRVRAHGTRLFVDVDLEGEVARRESRSGRVPPR